jgi:hypothetical protein
VTALVRACVFQGLDEPLMGGKKPAVGTPIRGGVFVLANTILGAGMLGLPARAAVEYAHASSHAPN